MLFLSSILLSPLQVSSRTKRLHQPLGEKGEQTAAHTLNYRLSTG